jgi:hypothetical protein
MIFLCVQLVVPSSYRRRQFPVNLLLPISDTHYYCYYLEVVLCSLLPIVRITVFQLEMKAARLVILLCASKALVAHVTPLRCLEFRDNFRVQSHLKKSP